MFLAVTDRERVKRRWPGMLLTLIVAGLAAAPMFAWLHGHPGAEQRFDQLGQPLRLLAAGDVRQVWANSLEALGMFTLRADDLWMYNLPGRPWLGAVEGVLFYGGVALACYRWRRPQYALALMWLLVGVLPSMITGVSASGTRAVALLPVIYLFPAVAVTAGLRWIRARWSPLPLDPPAPRSPVRDRSTITSKTGKSSLVIFHLSFVILSAFLILLAAARTYRDYFTVWANARDVRVAYHTTLFEIARDLDGRAIPQGGVVVQSSVYPGRYHDPYALDLILARRDLSMRWVDGRGALVFPAAPSHLIVSALAPLDPALEQAIAPPYARLIKSRRLRPDDLNPGFDVYDWDSTSALEALLSQTAGRPVAWSSSTTFPADDPQAVYRALDAPADLGGTIVLLGYDLSSPVVAPGDELALVTYWRVVSLPSPEVDTVLFTHLLAPGGDPPVVAQQDRLDAPAWNWHPGEVFAQVHRLVIGEEVGAGLYPLEVGAYTRPIPSPIDPNPPTTRLALFVDGQPVSDRILLPPVQVESQDDP
jgi:hypothetical protein